MNTGDRENHMSSRWLKLGLSVSVLPCGSAGPPLKHTFYPNSRMVKEFTSLRRTLFGLLGWVSKDSQVQVHKCHSDSDVQVGTRDCSTEQGSVPSCCGNALVATGPGCRRPGPPVPVGRKIGLKQASLGCRGNSAVGPASLSAPPPS